MISCGRRRIFGLLIGTIFLNPLLGASVSAGAGVLSGAHPDIGINDNFIKDMVVECAGGYSLTHKVGYAIFYAPRSEFL